MQDAFKFRKTPFTREVSVDEMLPMPHLDEARAALVDRIERRMSAAVIAPAGAGKTCLLRAVRHQLPEARYRVHYVKVTGLSKRDMCREIASAVGLEPAGTYPALVRKLEAHFAEAADGAGLRPVLILDEAHDLRPDVLSMVRLLTNFDMDSRLVLSIVLAGQPKLRELLRRDELEDVARRLAHYATLRTLSREELGRYVEHRCTVAGAASVPFDQAALDALFEIGRGNLRATDQLARKALELAHEADRDVCEPSHLAHARKLLWP